MSDDLINLFSVINNFILDWEGTKRGKITETPNSYIRLKNTIKNFKSRIDLLSYEKLRKPLDDLYKLTLNFHEINLKSLGWPSLERNKKNLDLIEEKCRELIEVIIEYKKANLEKQSKTAENADFTRKMQDYLDTMIELINQGFEKTNKELTRIYFAVQSGFMDNKKIDEKLYKKLENDEDLLQPIREELLYILAERDLYRAAAGIKRDPDFSKKIWDAIAAIEAAVGLLELAKELKIF